MESRVNRYKESDNDINNQEIEIKSRSSKNQKIYDTINNQELENVSIKANSSVLTEDAPNINIAQVRDMLDKKYRDEYDRKTISIPNESSYGDIEYEKTREYDINQILNNARNENAKNDYQEERLKKLRDTQFDILKNLDIKKKDTMPSSDDVQSMGLMELINTITENELSNTEIDPLDILSDLKGDENTKVINNNQEINNVQEIKDEQKVETKESNVSNTNSINTLTDSIEFNNSDFDDFNDIGKAKSNRIVAIIILVLLGIGFLAGLLVLLNYILGWGLF